MSLLPLSVDLFGSIDRQQLAKIENFPTGLLAGDLRPSYGDEALANPKVTTATQQETQRKNSQSYNAPALFFPSDLGQASNNKLYTQIDVFIVNTGEFYEKNKGNTGSKKPRNVQGDSTSLNSPISNFSYYADSNPTGSDTANNALKKISPAKYVNLQWSFGFPMPESLGSDYSTAWGRKDGGIVASGLALADALSDKDKRDKLDALRMAGMGLASGVAATLEKNNFSGANVAFELATKRSANPRSEFLFDGVNNRTFNLQWKLIPKNLREAENLNDIIRRLKVLMHPDIDKALNQAFYIYPAIFEITFMDGEVENEWLYKTSSCALTALSANATPASFFVGYESSGANVKGTAPLGYDLTLQFTELEFLHRGRFESGVVR